MTRTPVTQAERGLIDVAQPDALPPNIARWVEVAGVIGTDAALAVMELLGDTRMVIPTRACFISALSRQVRDAAVANMRACGVPGREITQAVRLHKRSIYKLGSRKMTRRKSASA